MQPALSRVLWGVQCWGTCDEVRVLQTQKLEPPCTEL